MKYSHFWLYLWVLIPFSGLCQTEVMSFNIRYDSPEDNENWWEYRKSEVVDLIKNQQSDFVGIQEATPNQLLYLEKELDSYDYIGFGREGLNSKSEGVPLFYLKNKYTLIKSEVFWLSSTPKTVSLGWDASYKRIVVYGSFKNEDTGEVWHVLNCHFDHQGKIAREKSAELLLSFIEDQNIASEKILLIGDFNCLPSEKPIQILKQLFTDAADSANVFGPSATFNAFDLEETPTKRIDYIFTRNLKINSFSTIDLRRKNNLYISDHFPIVIQVSSQ